MNFSVPRSDSVRNQAPAEPRTFRVAPAIAEDVAFAIESGDAEILMGVVKRHRLEIDTFTDGDVPKGVDAADLPPIRIVSVTGLPDAVELLLALPAAHVTEGEAFEIALRLLASGRQYPDNSAVSVMRHDGTELLLFGGFDTQNPSEPTYIFGFHPDHPIGRPLSSSIH